jgi:hypothetical protein
MRNGFEDLAGGVHLFFREIHTVSPISS